MSTRQSIPALVRDAESVGINLQLESDGQVRAFLPDNHTPRVVELLNKLRVHRDDVAGLLLAVQSLPAGLRIKCWEPRPSPAVITRQSVIMDVPAFIASAVRKLQQAGSADTVVARDLLEDLEQIGVTFERTR